MIADYLRRLADQLEQGPDTLALVIVTLPTDRMPGLTSHGEVWSKREIVERLVTAHLSRRAVEGPVKLDG